MKIYGITVVCSEGYFDATESRTCLFVSENDRNLKAWELYHNEVEKNGDELEDVINDKQSFICELVESGYIVGQWPSYHMQWEIFEQEI